MPRAGLHTVRTHLSSTWIPIGFVHLPIGISVAFINYTLVITVPNRTHLNLHEIIQPDSLKWIRYQSVQTHVWHKWAAVRVDRRFARAQLKIPANRVRNRPSDNVNTLTHIRESTNRWKKKTETVENHRSWFTSTLHMIIMYDQWSSLLTKNVGQRKY